MKLHSVSSASVSGRKAGFAQAPRPSRRTTVQVNAANALIVNTKGGGHSFIGMYLAKELTSKGHKAKLVKKAPYSAYADLAQSGVDICWGSPTDPSTWPKGDFQVVYDNNGKDMDSCKTLIDAFKGKVEHYVFVGSAGAYKADSIEPQHMEGDTRKASAGHVTVENYLVEQGMPYTVFQPLYIYGPNTGKDCEQWFVDRIIRDRPVPIPQPGIQMTTLTHVEDVASMLAAVVGNKAAIGQHYNVCSDRAITFVGITKAVSKALGKDPNILLYSPEEVGTGKSGKAEGFPFRTIHFFANSDKAKRDLGWKPKHVFLSDVADLVADYKKLGRESKEIDFTTDDKILRAKLALCTAVAGDGATHSLPCVPLLLEIGAQSS
eukprot:gene30153-35133_t